MCPPWILGTLRVNGTALYASHPTVLERIANPCKLEWWVGNIIP